MGSIKLGKRIREYREKAGYTQESIAEALELSVTAISNIERGINYPSLENFINFLNVVKVPADLLLADVVDCAYISKASELSEKLKNASPEKRKQIFTVIEALLAE